MRAAAIQMRTGADIDVNLAAAETLIRAAHADGAAFIATPENTLMTQDSTRQLFETIADEDGTYAIRFFAALAKELSIDLLIGSMAIKLGGGKAANRAFLFGPGGQIKARYDKIHMFDVTINERETWKESANYAAGKTPIMANIGAFNLGISICYDLRFAALYKYYADHGANVLAVPAAFTPVTGKAHWESLLRARAIETSSYVIAPAQGGVHNKKRTTWGHSLIIDPWGNIIAATGHDKPGYCIADLSLDVLNKTRAKIPAWQQTTALP